MKRYPVVLSIAGSDSSGGAGIQADLKTISSLGVYGATAITAITVQNTMGVSAVCPVPPEFVAGQIEAVMKDIVPDAVKIGMVNDLPTVRAITALLRKYRPRHVVFDPVMVATSGSRLMEDSAIGIIGKELVPLTDLVTPNLDEASLLTGKSISTPEDMADAARTLAASGSKAVLIKGGHLKGDDMLDILLMQGHEQPSVFRSRRIDSRNVHGTGCTLSAAIASFLALGLETQEAVEKAKQYVTEAIQAGKDIRTGNGNGPLNHLHRPRPMHIIPEDE